VSGPTPRQDDAQRRIHELLAELAEIIGPNGDAGPDDLGDGPSGKPALWDWALVCCWLDDDRQDWRTVIPAPGMLTHHVTGLLQAGLDDYAEPA
jgi:hypothetical protein